MARGRSRDEWDRCATLCVILANQNRAKGSRIFHLHDFHPFLQRKAEPQNATDAIRSLSSFFRDISSQRG